jgi:hypothetical protein
VSAAGFVFAVGLGAAVASEAPLARIIELHGEAMVNQGADFLPAREGMTLGDSDRVFVMENSRASLALNDGCVREIAALEKFTLANGQGCDAPGTGGDIIDNASSGAGVAADMRTIETAATGAMDERLLGLTILGTGAAAGAVWAATDQGSESNIVRRGPLSPE